MSGWSGFQTCLACSCRCISIKIIWTGQYVMSLFKARISVNILLPACICTGQMSRCTKRATAQCGLLHLVSSNMLMDEPILIFAGPRERSADAPARARPKLRRSSDGSAREVKGCDPSNIFGQHPYEGSHAPSAVGSLPQPCACPPQASRCLPQLAAHLAIAFKQFPL